MTCGNGTRIDTRTKNVEEMYGGNCDPVGNQKVEPCNTEICPRKAIDKNMLNNRTKNTRLS